MCYNVSLLYSHGEILGGSEKRVYCYENCCLKLAKSVEFNSAIVNESRNMQLLANINLLPTYR